MNAIFHRRKLHAYICQLKPVFDKKNKRIKNKIKEKSDSIEKGDLEWSVTEYSVL